MQEEASYSTVHITGCIQSHQEASDDSPEIHNYFLASVRPFQVTNKAIKDCSKEILMFSTRHDKNGGIRFIENE